MVLGRLVNNEIWAGGCEAGRNQTQWEILVTLTWQIIDGIKRIRQGALAGTRTMSIGTPSFLYKQLFYKQQGFNKLQIKQSEGFKVWN